MISRFVTFNIKLNDNLGCRFFIDRDFRDENKLAKGT